MFAPHLARPTPTRVTAIAAFLASAACVARPHPGALERDMSVALLDECPVVDRWAGAMGTGLALTIEAPSRAEALSASEAVLRAIEATEQRLSTWREDSELSELNRSASGERIVLSSELAHELAAVHRWSRLTQGAFDPAVGALVRAWDLRGAGRIPTAEERQAAIVLGGIAAALELDGRSALRVDPSLLLEEGGFGKGAGLDAALSALRGTKACSATLDFGGQVAWYAPIGAHAPRGESGGPDAATDRRGARGRPFDIADPRDRSRRIATLRSARNSAATSGNSEHARVVGGRTIGHLLDPRSGEPAANFGSVTVVADLAIDADCLSTGLFVLGPERALEFAAEHAAIDVVVVEVLPSGHLRLRASAGVAETIELLVEDIDSSDAGPSHNPRPPTDR